MRWPFTFYTDDMATWQGGYAYGPVIKIRPQYKEDEGIYQHELTHVKQWLLTLSLHWALYRIRRYRLWSEAQAYRKQMLYPDGNGGFLSVENAALRLANPNYNLDITPAQAEQYLLVNNTKINGWLWPNQ